MYTEEALREIHRRAHQSLQGLIKHCSQLTEEQINKELEGFGYPTIRLQLHHIIGSEKYWIGVLEGRIDADEDDPKYPTIESLEAYRKEIFSLAENYLQSVSTEELNTARMMNTWGGNEKSLSPVHVFLRTQVHVYQHQGQVTAMCRLLGSPINGIDYDHS